MSSDDGIYILETKDPQYRIIHGMAIENIGYSYIDERFHDYVPTRIVEMYGNCKFTRDKMKALDMAFKWDEKLGREFYPSEYGVRFIKHNKTWKQILEDAVEYAKKEIEAIDNRGKNWQEGYKKSLKKIIDGKYH